MSRNMKQEVTKHSKHIMHATTQIRAAQIFPVTLVLFLTLISAALTSAVEGSS